MGYNTILGRYVSKTLLSTFIGILFMVASIVLLFDMIEMLRAYGGNEMASFGTILELSLSKMPETVDMVLPFVMLVAAQATFYKLSKSNEFVIIRTAGVDLWQFLKPFLYTTFLIGAVNVMLINPLITKMYEVHETITYRLETKNPKAFVFSDKGLWIREGQKKHSIVLNAKNVRQDDDGLFMKNVLILEINKASELERRIEAFVGVLNNKTIDLKDVKIFELGKPVKKLSSLKYQTTLDTNRVKESFIEPDAISFWDLPNTIAFYEKAGFSAQKHKIKFLSLIALPFLLCSMVLLAAIFSLQSNTRKGGVIYLIVSGISTGFTVYFLSELIYALGSNNMFPPLLSAFAPTLIVSLISISVLLQMEEK